jgi:hypothetical protein
MKVETQLLALAAISVRYFFASCWPGVRIPARDDSTLFIRDPVEGGAGGGDADDATSCGSGIAKVGDVGVIGEIDVGLRVECQ